MIRITDALIEAGSTSGCGFTVRQIRLLGEHPRKGWRRRAIGRLMTREKAIEFLTTARRRAHRIDKAEAERQVDRLASDAHSKAAKREPVICETADDTACPICAGSGVDPMGRSCDLCSPPWEPAA